jgi:ATP-dependent RNA helicase DDX55/SPB4
MNPSALSGKSLKKKPGSAAASSARLSAAAPKAMSPPAPAATAAAKPDAATAKATAVVAASVPNARRWETLDLTEGIMDGIRAFGFESMTPVQAFAIPAFLSHKDVCVQAVTGSGKTLAFAIPVIEMLLRRAKPLGRHDVGAVILSPTRELAQQTHSVFHHFLSRLPPASGAGGSATPTLRTCIGGTNATAEAASIAAEGGNILVGTPGRLEQILSGVALTARTLEVLVLDEADRLLEQGFQASLNAILARLPKQRRTGLFSATLTEQVEELAKAGLRNPVKITVRVQYKQQTGSETVQRARVDALAAAEARAVAAAEAADALDSDDDDAADARAAAAAAARAAKSAAAAAEGGVDAPVALTHQAIPSSLSNYFTFVPVEQKLLQLVEFLRAHKNDKVIIFCLTCAFVDYVHRVLAEYPEICALFSPLDGSRAAADAATASPARPVLAALHGKLAQSKRDSIYTAFRAAPAGALLCTDVAARGIDVPDISWVLQLEPPQHPEFYTHRIGRAARAGREGAAVIFLAPHERGFVDYLHSRSIPALELPAPPLPAAAAASLLAPVAERYFFLRGAPEQTVVAESAAAAAGGAEGGKQRVTVTADAAALVATTKAAVTAAGGDTSAVGTAGYPAPPLLVLDKSVLRLENGQLYMDKAALAAKEAEKEQGSGRAGVQLQAADAAKLAQLRRKLKITRKDADKIREKQLKEAAAKAGIARAGADGEDEKGQTLKLPRGACIEVLSSGALAAADAAGAAAGAKKSKARGAGGGWASVIEFARYKSVTDRAFLLLGASAFTAYVRAYKEHKLRFTLPFASLPFVRLALGLGLAYLPLLPDLKRYKLSYPRLTRVPAHCVPYASAEKEARREDEDAAKRVKNEASRDARLAREKERDKERERREEIRRKKNKTKKKQTYEEFESEWNELADEMRTIKRSRSKKGRKGGRGADSDDDSSDDDAVSASDSDDDEKVRLPVRGQSKGRSKGQSKGQSKAGSDSESEDSEFDELDELVNSLRADRAAASKGKNKRRSADDDDDDDDEEEDEDEDEDGDEDEDEDEDSRGVDRVSVRGHASSSQAEDEDEDDDEDWQEGEGDEGDVDDAAGSAMRNAILRMLMGGGGEGDEGDEGDMEGDDEGDEDDAENYDEDEDEDGEIVSDSDADAEDAGGSPHTPTSTGAGGGAGPASPRPILRRAGSDASPHRVKFAPKGQLEQVREIPRVVKPPRGLAHSAAAGGFNAALMQRAMQMSLAQLQAANAARRERAVQQQQQQQQHAQRQQPQQQQQQQMRAHAQAQAHARLEQARQQQLAQQQAQQRQQNNMARQQQRNANKALMQRIGHQMRR